MDAVFVVGAGSRHDDLELRCSLRSLEQYITGIDRVIVVGNRPRWLKNVIYIPWPDRYPCKERNIMDKILQACEVINGDEFLQIHDDYFALQPQDAATIPFWADGLLGHTATRAATAVYRRSLENTDHALTFAKLPTIHFDVHVPIRYDRRYFGQVMGMYDWNVPAGYVVKSLYCNTLASMGIDPVPLPDLKLRRPSSLRYVVDQLRGRPWWSIGDLALQGPVKDLLLALYPKKSKFEI